MIACITNCGSFLEDVSTNLLDNRLPRQQQSSFSPSSKEVFVTDTPTPMKAELPLVALAATSSGTKRSKDEGTPV